MRVNMEKTKCMHIGFSNPCLSACIGGTNIPVTTSERDLGVYVLDNLKPSLQCQKASAKAQRILSMIKRTFKNLNVTLLRKIYKAFVRPHLEYCCPAWSPYLVKDIEILEKVQRRMTRILSEYRTLSYLDRLKNL